jgi:hypothetical protein
MSDIDGANGDGRRRHKGLGWVGALILIGIGLIFLLRGLGFQLPSNLWAVILLVPALASLVTAWRLYGQHGGKVTYQVLGPLVGGLVLLALAVVFLLDIPVNWEVLWPIGLIAIGVGALARNFLK